MKKILILLAVILTATVSNAQIFVGGSIGLNINSEKDEVGSNITADESVFGFTLNPRVGYFLNEKLAVGAGVLFGISTTSGNLDPKTKEKNMNWGVAPFARYYFVEFGNFSVLAEATLGIGGGTSSFKVGSTETDGPGTFNVGLNVVPIVSYKLSEKVSLEAGLNFLNLGFNFGSTTTEVPLGEDIVTKSNGFTLGVNSANVANVGLLNIGFIYKL